MVEQVAGTSFCFIRINEMGFIEKSNEPISEKMYSNVLVAWCSMLLLCRREISLRNKIVCNPVRW